MNIVVTVLKVTERVSYVKLQFQSVNQKYQWQWTCEWLCACRQCNNYILVIHIHTPHKRKHSTVHHNTQSSQISKKEESRKQRSGERGGRQPRASWQLTEGVVTTAPTPQTLHWCQKWDSFLQNLFVNSADSCVLQISEGRTPSLRWFGNPELWLSCGCTQQCWWSRTALMFYLEV